ncbi:HNH endonuclease [Hansschlegelia zhihuaiae]|uniref:HNH endonuclease n=2 Tax=Hansschlegelia zhihuaiae TaxID=405005 RepID=A0A4Q0MHN1_9HYPH|nr:HNH endonuclease [Hansschlegelia zhihuaiae]
MLEHLDVSDVHRGALTWLAANSGRSVSWSEMDNAFPELGVRLVTKAKGIYKPKWPSGYPDYALTVRQTLGGPYDDRPLERHDDGSWTFRYFQENPDPGQRDREATNRGLMQCMADGVPVGVLIQNKPKPGVAYDLLGLASVIGWDAGLFELTSYEGDRGAMEMRTALAGEDVDEFDLAALTDQRERRVAEVVRRRGQPVFRARLLEAYEGKCAISGCDAPEALEAAHIARYTGTASNDPRNGLLLRADLHNLFDLGLLAVDPNGFVVIADALRGTTYADFAGRPITRPAAQALTPSPQSLAAHLKWSGLALTD